MPYLTRSLMKQKDQIEGWVRELEREDFINPKNFAESRARLILATFSNLLLVVMCYSMVMGFVYVIVPSFVALVREYSPARLWETIYWAVVYLLPTILFVTIIEEIEHPRFRALKHLKKRGVWVQVGYSRNATDKMLATFKKVVLADSSPDATEANSRLEARREQFYRDRLIFEDIFFERHKLSSILGGIVVYLLLFAAATAIIVYGGLESVLVYTTTWAVSVPFLTPIAILLLIGLRLTIEFFGYSYDLDFVDENYIAMHYLEDFFGTNKDEEYFIFLLSEGTNQRNVVDNLQCPICNDFKAHCERRLGEMIHQAKVHEKVQGGSLDSKSNQGQPPQLTAPVFMDNPDPATRELFANLESVDQFYQLDDEDQFRLVHHLPLATGYTSPLDRLVERRDLFMMHWLKLIFVKLEEHLAKHSIKCELHKFPTNLLEYFAILLEEGDRDEEMGHFKVFLKGLREHLRVKNIPGIIIDTNAFYFDHIEPRVKNLLDKYHIEGGADDTVESLFTRVVPFDINFLPKLTLGERLTLAKNKFSNSLITLSSVVGTLTTVLAIFGLG